ncbi:MAG: tetratricopeptide repeat protein, partial [Nitrospirae bacterium]|nr:tetratricopeptide repeat protein [Nitrospirota bacterium]
MKIGSLATVALLVISLLVSARVDAVNIKALSSPELKQAWLLFEMGNYKRADEALKSCYLKTTEDGATCSFLHARILDGQKNSLGAIDAYRKAYTFSSNPDIKQESLFRKSELFAEKNYAFETQKGFSEYVKLYPNAKNSKKAYLHLAQSLDASNKPAEALAAYEKAGEGSLALYGKANVLQKTGKTKEAQQAYDKAVGLDSDYLGKSDETRYLYAENLVQTGNIPKAKEMLKLITNEKLKEKADLTLGTLEAGDKKNAEAAKYLAKAATAKNRDVKVKALMRLAHVQAESAKPADAQQTLDT